MSEGVTTAPLPDEQSRPTAAAYPFNDEPDLADIILLASDGNKFYVNKGVLSAASPVFKTMFTLSPPDNESQVTGDRPSIPVQDEAKDLFQLLSWCDPRGRPSITLEGFQVALKLADKYGMDPIVKRVGEIMELCEELIKKECINMYALAIQYRFPNLAKLSARCSLALSIEEISDSEVPELAHIPATALKNLYQYHFACSRAARASIYLNDRLWLLVAPSVWAEIQVFRITCANCPEYGRYGFSRPWVVEYMDQIGDVLWKTPIGAKARDQSILYSTLNKMNKCGSVSSCRTQHDIFLKLVDSVIQRIDEATAKISIGTEN